MNCYGKVQVWYQYGGLFDVGTDCEGGVRTTPIKMHGIGQATRIGDYPGTDPASCPGFPPVPCYYYTGGAQSITITPIDMQLKLRPSAFVVTSGTSVTSTAFGTPDSVYPYKLPFAVQSWQWTPDTGTASTPCSAGTTQCAKAITASGTMHVVAVVNGEVANESVHIRVLCDTTNNPLLNNYPLLDAMQHAWEAGWADLPIDRREASWTVDCDADGICYLNWYVDPVATPCNTVFPDPPLPGRTRIASGHTHPVTPDGYPGYPPEGQPAGCRGQETPQFPSNKPRYPAAGPSPKDRDNSAAQPTPGVTHCIMDLVKIYCYPLGVPKSEAKSQEIQTRRETNGCRLAALDIRHLRAAEPPDVMTTEEV